MLVTLLPAAPSIWPSRPHSRAEMARSRELHLSPMSQESTGTTFRRAPGRESHSNEHRVICGTPQDRCAAVFQPTGETATFGDEPLDSPYGLVTTMDVCTFAPELYVSVACEMPFTVKVTLATRLWMFPVLTEQLPLAVVVQVAVPV